ncbi:MAG: hypothetical protein AAF530_09670 [Pseudomonadota bacterium]
MTLLSGLFLLAVLSSAKAELVFKPIPTQFIAALGDKEAIAGTGAEHWGLWRVDPGPRGVWLDDYDALKAANGKAPKGWQFDGTDWWLEENGLIMEQPVFSIKPGKYLVTGDREVITVLTIEEPGKDGAMAWSLDNDATLYDVTHLRCRSARYTPLFGGESCSPANASSTAFPVRPGGIMPSVPGCKKQDYAVLFLIAVALEE